MDLPLPGEVAAFCRRLLVSLLALLSASSHSFRCWHTSGDPAPGRSPYLTMPRRGHHLHGVLLRDRLRDGGVVRAEARAVRARSGGGDDRLGRLTQIMRRHPRETPVRLVEVASVIMDCDLDAQFTFGLDLMLTSLKARRGETQK